MSQIRTRIATVGGVPLFGVRRLVAALLFQHGIFVNRLGKTTNMPFQFQVKSAEQTNDVPGAKLPEKESGDGSPHSKGRLIEDYFGAAGVSSFDVASSNAFCWASTAFFCSTSLRFIMPS